MLKVSFAIVSILASFAAIAADQKPATNWKDMAEAIRGEMPHGAVSSWSKEQRAAAIKALASCNPMATRSASTSGSPTLPELLRARYFSLECEYRAAPAGWPGRPQLEDLVRKQYHFLHRFDARVPAPDLGP